MIFGKTSNEQISQRVISEFLQRATSATSNKGISQRVKIDFTTSNEQRVKSYASYVRCPSRILKFLQDFMKLAFFPLSFDISSR